MHELFGRTRVFGIAAQELDLSVDREAFAILLLGRYARIEHRTSRNRWKARPDAGASPLRDCRTIAGAPVCGIELAGNRLPQAPRLSLGLCASYTVPLGSAGLTLARGTTGGRESISPNSIFLSLRSAQPARSTFRFAMKAATGNGMPASLPATSLTNPSSPGLCEFSATGVAGAGKIAAEPSGRRLARPPVLGIRATSKGLCLGQGNTIRRRKRCQARLPDPRNVTPQASPAFRPWRYELKRTGDVYASLFACPNVSRYMPRTCAGMARRAQRSMGGRLRRWPMTSSPSLRRCALKGAIMSGTRLATSPACWPKSGTREHSGR